MLALIALIYLYYRSERVTSLVLQGYENHDMDTVGNSRAKRNGLHKTVKRHHET